MGEDRKDRCGLLAQLASQSPHPESVPDQLVGSGPGNSIWKNNLISIH